jgi:hypothetical protein
MTDIPEQAVAAIRQTGQVVSDETLAHAGR